MILKDYLPQKWMSEYVRCFRIVHFDFTASALPPPKPYTPRPEICLAFYPYDKETVTYEDGKIIKDVNVALIGQQTTVTNRTIGRHFMVLQIIFQPGALFRLTKIPLHYLSNQYLDANELDIGKLDEVNEQLYFARDYSEMVRIASAFVTKLIQKAKMDIQPIDHICQVMQSGDDKWTLDKLAKSSCYSIRAFERNFKARTGVNPVTFQRILRFDRAFRLKNIKPASTWTNIAYEVGFHDYQHLAKDYQLFTGMLPEKFHSLETPEGTLGLSEGFYENEIINA
ncbi:MAG: AraC family transcriptional regulator [Saprospiraceae bacterium]|nr:AraC family transcriptional regulator [Saprospiraceae bacterium]